jgi:histidinol dehydrogenase
MDLHRIDAAVLDTANGPRAAAAQLRALVPGGASVSEAVRRIVADVRREGDAAVLRHTRAFDTPEVEPLPLVVAPEELDEAIVQLPRELVAGLQVAIANVALVSEAGVGADAAVDLPQGHRVVLREVPVRAAAVYVPGGRAPYPSTVVMGVVTARAAGVLDVAVCAPPGRQGQIHPLILGTCRLCGVERVYRMGGAQAIAALAYGTESVTAVDVIVGPGNLYVQEAKHQVSTVVVDGFAGPSDLMVVLGADLDDETLHAAALDMLAQAEHGAGSIVVAASPSTETCDRLAARLEQLVLERPTVGEAAFAVVGASSPRQAIELANAFAPEHLQLIGADVEALAPAIVAAGCLFVGADSATAFGDYVAGSNHVLPTDGAARFSSTLSPRHFRRRMAEVRVSPEAAARLAAAGAPIARAEGFAVHAESMEARVRENPLT